MFKVRTNQVFTSKATGVKIRAKSSAVSRDSFVSVVTLGSGGKPIRGSSRVIYADSIRRKYNRA